MNDYGFEPVGPSFISACPGGVMEDREVLMALFDRALRLPQGTPEVEAIFRALNEALTHLGPEDAHGHH
jgi:hypothetical protein